jgi:predicted nucleic acid-binding protein
MYLVGAAHPLKSAAQKLMERYVLEKRRLVTDAEVLQEILHRYIAINRRDAIQPSFDLLLGVVDEVFSVDLHSIEKAKAILLGNKRLSARDALHLAIMEEHKITQILSFDKGFDEFPGIYRLK